MSTATNVTRIHPDRDSESLPEPFLPPDVDLTGFHFLPVMPDRLDSSPDWRRAKREPLYAYRFITLLMATFRQIPAGSLPDDDLFFIDLLGLSDEQWPEIKEATMRSWTLCSDGRWHHHLAAAFVAEAWKGRQANHRRTNRANEANAERRAERQRDAERDAQRDAQRDADVTSHQGREEKEANQSKEVNEPKDSLAPAAAAPARSRGTRIPADWQPDRDYAKSKGLYGRALDEEVEKFRNYWTAKAGSGATKLDWPATWQNWVIEALARIASRPQRKPERNPNDI